MRVLVLGGRGFLGRHLVAALSERGHEAIVGTRQATLPLEAEADLDAPESIDRALRELRPGAVVNCASYGLDPSARDPVEALRTNVLGAAAALRAAERFGVARFVHFGTCFEFGSHELPVTESTPLRPIGIYATSKAAASLVLTDLARESCVESVLLRPFVMVGPGERPSKLVPQILATASTREPLLLTEGREVRDYVDVQFVAAAAAALISLDAGAFPRGESFSLCSGSPRTVRQFAEEVAESLGITELLRFGARPSRHDVPASIVGCPDRWRDFAKRTSPTIPVSARALPETIKDLVAGARAP